MIYYKLILIRSLNGRFQAKRGLSRIGIANDRKRTCLDTVMAFAVISRLDHAVFSRSDGFFGELAHGAATTCRHIADEKRGGARVGEMEGICHLLTLQHRAKIMLCLVENDDGLFVGRLGG